MKHIMIGLCLLAPLPAFALPSSILDCLAPAQGLKQCRIKSIPAVQAAFEGETFDALYEVTIDGECGNSNLRVPIQFQIESQTVLDARVTLNQKNQVFVPQGRGRLTIADPNPILKTFPERCDIVVKSVEFRPNGPTTLTKWLTEAASVTNLLNRSTEVFERKGELLSYHAIYIQAEGDDKTEIKGLLEEILSQLAEDDGSRTVILAILEAAPRSTIEAIYEEFASSIKGYIAAGAILQKKIVYARAEEYAPLKTAITSAEDILKNN